MLILAVDTSTTSGSVALASGGRLVSEWTVGDAGTHAHWLMGGIDALVKRSGVDLAGIDAFALSIGPGSFTGLRIGVSTIKGLAWTLGKPVIGVSTLRALAMSAGPGGAEAPLVCPVLDARKKEVYTALYRRSNRGLEALVDDGPRAPEEMAGLIGDKADGPVVFLGGGLEKYGEVFTKGVEDAVLAPENLWHVRASNVALLAEQSSASAVKAGELTPRYMRRSEAEIKAAEKERGG